MLIEIAPGVYIRPGQVSVVAAVQAEEKGELVEAVRVTFIGGEQITLSINNVTGKEAAHHLVKVLNGEKQ